MSDAAITELSACAGVILIGTGLRVLEIKPIRTLNMVPALVLVPLVSAGLRFAFGN